LPVFGTVSSLQRRRRRRSSRKAPKHPDSEKLAKHLHQPPPVGGEARCSIRRPPPIPPPPPRTLRTPLHDRSLQHRTLTTDPLLALVLAHVRVIAFQTTIDRSLICSSLCVCFAPPSSDLRTHHDRRVFRRDKSHCTRSGSPCARRRCRCSRRMCRRDPGAPRRFHSTQVPVA